jgi:L-lactate dehydrogenase complex protein LldF
VYRKIGGHNYPWVYSGPIGAILSPQFHGVATDPWLPYASSLCGACAEVCPVKIEIPKILLELRHEVTDAKRKTGDGRMEKLIFQLYSFVMTRPSLYSFLAGMAPKFFPGKRDGAWINHVPGVMAIPPVAGWLSQRDHWRPEPRRPTRRNYGKTIPRKTARRDGGSDHLRESSERRSAGRKWDPVQIDLVGQLP